MAIQWFPGHMTSARKKAEETMEHIDVVIEVLDARVPAASHNPMIEDMRNFRQRPNLKILNKADLADPQITQAWLNYFNAQPNTKAVALSCKKAGDAKKNSRPVPPAGAAPRDAFKTPAHADHGHPQRGQVDADECAAQPAGGQGW